MTMMNVELVWVLASGQMQVRFTTANTLVDIIHPALVILFQRNFEKGKQIRKGKAKRGTHLHWRPNPDVVLHAYFACAKISWHANPS